MTYNAARERFEINAADGIAGLHAMGFRLCDMVWSTHSVEVAARVVWFADTEAVAVIRAGMLLRDAHGSRRQEEAERASTAWTRRMGRKWLLI